MKWLCLGNDFRSGIQRETLRHINIYLLYLHLLFLNLRLFIQISHGFLGKRCLLTLLYLNRWCTKAGALRLASFQKLCSRADQLNHLLVNSICWNLHTEQFEEFRLTDCGFPLDHFWFGAKEYELSVVGCKGVERKFVGAKSTALFGFRVCPIWKRHTIDWMLLFDVSLKIL